MARGYLPPQPTGESNLELISVHVLGQQIFLLRKPRIHGPRLLCMQEPKEDTSSRLQLRRLIRYSAHRTCSQ